MLLLPYTFPLFQAGCAFAAFCVRILFYNKLVGNDRHERNGNDALEAG